MAFSLKVSNNLGELSAELCDALRSQNGSVFQPWYIITQTSGMENWLKMEMAEHLGIAANYKFLKPNDVVFKIFQALGESYRESLTMEHLIWLFFGVLDEEEFKQRFSSVASYYRNDAPDTDIKRLALAQKTADLIDQYQIYRPDMVARWNNSPEFSSSVEEWQRYLWVRAKELIGDKELPDRTLMGQSILSRLKDSRNTELLFSRIPVIHIFGLSVFTSYHMDIFTEVGKYIDIKFYLLNPAPSQYWFDDKSLRTLSFLSRLGKVAPEDAGVEQGNELLLSWGKLVKNTFSLLFKNEALLDAYETVGERDPGDDSLLHIIQQDIFYNRKNEERDPLFEDILQDGTISINSCFSPVREVEALYNYLVTLIDERAEPLSARDVVVMVSDIDAYAPFIRAIFDNAPYKFFYTLADERVSNEYTISAAVLSLLEINEKDFKAEKILQLLENPYIRNHYGINDVAFLRRVTDRANIRDGIRGSLDDDTVYISWLYGLDKLIYGLCMDDDTEYIAPDGLVYDPLGVAEGQSSAEIVRFAYFVRSLIDLVSERKRSRTLEEWGNYVDYLLQAFLINNSDIEGEEDFQTLRKNLELYNELSGTLIERIEYEVFFSRFKSTISGITRGSRFGAGGITFCSLIPMRSIPFDVVAILGLNFDKFPRVEKRVDFDLMTKESRQGDRNIKDNDKHLFMETLLSAGKYFYISYLGQGIRDNAHMPPSIVVEELIHYISDRYEGEGKVSDLLITQHPLHRFSARYNPNDIPVYNYLDTKSPARVEAGETIKQAETSSDLSVSLLTAFFKNSVSYYYRNVLDIDLNNPKTVLPDTELFSMDESDRRYLNEIALTKAPVDGVAFDGRWIRMGYLPLKNMGSLAWNQLTEDTEFLRNTFNGLAGEHRSRAIDIKIELAEGTLNGTIADIYDNKLILIATGKTELKHLVDGYIKNILLSAAGFSCEVWVLSKTREEKFKAATLSKAQALIELESLYAFCREYTNKLFFFHPDWVSFKDLTKFDQLNDEKREALIRNGIKSLASYDLYLKMEMRERKYNGLSLTDDYYKGFALLLRPVISTFQNYFN